jgi:hypothetical protein
MSTNLTISTTSSPVITSSSPRSSNTEMKPSQHVSEGIGNENSSFSSANNNTNKISPRRNNSNEPNRTENSVSLDSLIRPSTSTNKGKGTDPEPSSSISSSSDATIPMIISTIFQRFLVRMPHTFIAMAGVFVPLYYGLDKESLAISATTFVGVGGTVYCFVRAFFLETIPVWMLQKNNDTKIWRRLMNITYTGFITAMFTTAVWKLPDITTAQGFGFLTVSFVAPYPLLAKFYPDIDKLPSNFERKYNTKL